MNTKIINKLVLLSLMLPVICAARPAMQFYGVYAGPSVAATATTISNQLSFSPKEVEDAYLYDRHQYGSVSQVQPGFVVGYERVFNLFHHCWLAGGEAQVNFLKSYVNLSGMEYVNKAVTANNQIALQLRGGISLSDNDNFFYALIGVARTQTNIKIVFNNAFTTAGTLGALQMSPVNTTRKSTGLKFGAGYEKRLTCNLSLRVDYSHTQYGTFKNALSDGKFFDIMGDLGTSALTQSADMLGITFMFMA